MKKKIISIVMSLILMLSLSVGSVSADSGITVKLNGEILLLMFHPNLSMTEQWFL